MAPTAPMMQCSTKWKNDFLEAMELLPSRDEGSEWSGGRATCGAAAGYYARALMMRQKSTAKHFRY